MKSTPDPSAPQLIAGRLTAAVAALLVLVAGLLVTGPVASASDPDHAGRRVVATGPTDVLHLRFDGDRLDLGTKVGEAPYEELLTADQVVHRIDDAGRRAVPDDLRFAFLGAPGDPLWIAPEVRDPALLWPSWSTQAIAPGALVDDTVEMRLTDSDGPGHVEIFQTHTEGPTRLLGSRDLSRVHRQAVGARAHATWAFSAPGQYRLTFEARATSAVSGRAVTTGPVTYVFEVGANEQGSGFAPSPGPDGSEPDDETVVTRPNGDDEVGGIGHDSTNGTGTGGEADAPSDSPEPAVARAGTDGACAGLDVVLADGHIDIAARLVDGRLRTQVKDTTLAPTPVYWRNLETVGLHVTDDALTAVPPGAAYEFLGAAGDEVWLLPQTQQAGILWPGWNTEAIDYSQLNGPVTWSLDQVRGPGSLAVYELGSVGDVRVVFDSKRALPQTLDLGIPTHAHGNWVFTEPGIYHLTFSHRATSRNGSALTSGGTVAVAVGDVDLAGLCPGGTVPPPGGGHGGEVDHGDQTPPSTDPTAPDDSTPSTAPAGQPSRPAPSSAPRAPRECAPIPTAAPQSSPSAESTTTTAPAGPAAPTAAPVVLADGHIDYGVRIDDGRLRSLVKDGTVAGRTEWRDPDSVVLHLTEAGVTEVPDRGFDFLGSPGAKVWQIPQTQKSGVIWLGWNTEEVRAEQVEGDITWTLDSVDGPGELVVFEYDSFGSPQLIFNTREGGGDTHEIPVGVHAHGNWAFTAKGAYRITSTHRATLASGERVSDTQTLLVAVGDTDPASLAPGPAAPEQADTGSPAAAPVPSSAPAPVVVTGPDGCPRLASTGFDPGLPLRLGAALLLAGLLAVGATRRPTPHV